MVFSTAFGTRQNFLHQSSEDEHIRVEESTNAVHLAL